MYSKTLFLLAFTITVCGGVSASQAACYDVSKGEPRQLFGHLSHRIFAGPPNFEDVQKGDTPEPGYVLKLTRPICITGDDFADPSNMFDEVQLLPGKGLEKKMASFRDADVTVDLVDPMAAFNAHHHRPLLISVKTISPIRDVTESYGTAATMIEAFYAALHSGDGDLAAGFIIPEKTRKGAYAPKELNRFYSSLAEPITLIDVRPAGENRYDVRYHFRNGKNTCNGTATITTVMRDERNFIQAISAQNGC